DLGHQLRAQYPPQAGAGFVAGLVARLRTGAGQPGRYPGGIASNQQRDPHGIKTLRQRWHGKTERFEQHYPFKIWRRFELPDHPNLKVKRNGKHRFCPGRIRPGAGEFDPLFTLLPGKTRIFSGGQNFFAFNMGHNIRPFYSRRIGISPERTEIPILGGVRLLGKLGRSTLGVMSLQTEEKNSFPSTNYSVLRWKQDVLEQSSLGLIGISKIEPHRWNATYGADFLYSTSSLFGDKNFSVGGALVQSYTSDARTKTGLAHRIRLSYPNDFIEFAALWERASATFNPEVGFLRRTSFQQFFAELKFKPRPKFLPWIRQMEFKPMDFNYFIDDETKELTTFFSEFRPLGFATKSGEFFEFNIQRRAEKLTEDFEIQNGVIIAPGEYWFTRYEIQLATFTGRPLFGFFEVNWGDFYNGKRTEWSGRIVWRMNKHFSLSGDYTRNVVNLPAGNFTVDEVGGRMEFAVTPKLFGSLFAQWNNEDQEILLNFRINWIPKPGTDFFFVINQAVDTSSQTFIVSNTTVLTKFVWRFVL
ncbi:MAG: hypothetical protein D6813_10790, partial [Calditrichaeota bacterium]